MATSDFPKLYPILDSGYLPMEGRADFLARLIPELAAAGVGILQYRNKCGTESEILADARVLREAAGDRMLLVMNDWPDLAVKAGFDGVHVGQTDLTPAEARTIVGPDRAVGISTHNAMQLRAANASPVDYVGFGPVYPTATKQNPDPVVGLEGVRMARSLTQKPLVAIGGITAENAPEVWAAGADSVAVISAVFGPDFDPSERVRRFVQSVRNAAT